MENVLDTKATHFSLFSGADIKLLSRNPLAISHLVHSFFPDGTRITRVAHLLTDSLPAETPSAGITGDEGFEAGPLSLGIIEDWVSFDPREYRPLSQRLQILSHVLRLMLSSLPILDQAHPAFNSRNAMQ